MTKRIHIGVRVCECVGGGGGGGVEILIMATAIDTWRLLIILPRSWPKT